MSLFCGVFSVKTTCGEGSRVLQLERVRLRREGGGLASSSMERGWLRRLLTWIRWEGEDKVIMQRQDDDALTGMKIMKMRNRQRRNEGMVATCVPNCMFWREEQEGSL